MRLRLARAPEKFELHHRASVRPSDITQAIFDTKPAIIHFSGHGISTGELLFENDFGQIHPIEPDALESLFALLRDEIRCVILNACYSHKQARAISKHIDNVIGMNSNIGDNAAIAFSVGFYKAFCDGRAVQDCYEFGRTELRLLNIPEHNAPVILRRSETKHEFIPDEIYRRGSFPRLPVEYSSFAKLIMRDGLRKGSIAIDPDAYESIGALLDDVYMNYLRDQVPILSYGKHWIISMPSNDCRGFDQPVAPLKWLLERDATAYAPHRASWQRLRPAEVGVECGLDGEIRFSVNGWLRDQAFVLAIYNPLTLKILEKGPKAVLVLLPEMTRISREEFDRNQYLLTTLLLDVDQLHFSGTGQGSDDHSIVALTDTELTDARLSEIHGHFEYIYE